MEVEVNFAVCPGVSGGTLTLICSFLWASCALCRAPLHLLTFPNHFGKQQPRLETPTFRAFGLRRIAFHRANSQFPFPLPHRSGLVFIPCSQGTKDCLVGAGEEWPLRADGRMWEPASQMPALNGLGRGEEAGAPWGCVVWALDGNPGSPRCANCQLRPPRIGPPLFNGRRFHQEICLAFLPPSHRVERLFCEPRPLTATGREWANPVCAALRLAAPTPGPAHM